MKKGLFIITILVTLVFLTGCKIYLFTPSGPERCDPKYNVSEEQVKKDFKENK